MKKSVAQALKMNKMKRLLSFLYFELNKHWSNALNVENIRWNVFGIVEERIEKSDERRSGEYEHWMVAMVTVIWQPYLYTMPPIDAHFICAHSSSKSAAICLTGNKHQYTHAYLLHSTLRAVQLRSIRIIRLNYNKKWNKIAPIQMYEKEEKLFFALHLHVCMAFSFTTILWHSKPSHVPKY